MNKGFVLIAGMFLASMSMVPAAHAQQPYLGVGIGAFNLNPGNDGHLALGGYLRAGMDFMPYLGVEARVGTTDKAVRSTVNWFTGIYAKPKVDISQYTTLYSLLGVTAMNASHYSGTTGIYQEATKESFSYGFGIEYWSGYQVTVDTEWMRYMNRADATTKDTNFGGLTVDAYSFSVDYHF